MTFDEFKTQLTPEDFMINNLLDTMRKCFEAGQKSTSSNKQN